MPSGSPGKGYLSKAALRIIGYNSGAYAYPTALGTPTPQTLSDGDLIPFISESIGERFGWLDDAVLDGTAGRSQIDNISKLANGGLELRGHYLGIGQLLSAVMGYERVRSASILESPQVISAADTGTATAGGALSLTDGSKSWVTDAYAGAWVRNEKLAASANGKIDVRRISSNTGTVLTIIPAWGTNPASGDPYSIGFAWLHSYEMSENLHSEPVTNIITTEDAWNNSAYLVRLVCVGIDKGVAVWEWQACAVEETTFKLGKDGLFISAELVPFGTDRRTSSRNSDTTNWSYSRMIRSAIPYNSQYLKNRPILRGDATFRLGAYSTSVGLDSSNNVGVSELEIKIKNNLQADLQTTSSGKFICEPVRSGRREVTGSFTVPRHTAVTRLSNYTDQDMLMAHLNFTVTNGIYNAVDNKLDFWLKSLKLTKADVAVGGPQVLEEKYNFTALQPAGASANMPTCSAGSANSELIVQLQNANPFNYFMGQHHAT